MTEKNRNNASKLTRDVAKRKNLIYLPIKPCLEKKKKKPILQLVSYAAAANASE